MGNSTIKDLSEILARAGSLFETGSSGFVPTQPHLFELLLDAVETIVFVADTDGRLRYTNAAWERLTGFSPTDTRGLPNAYYLHPSDQDRWVRFLDASKRDPEGHPILVLRFLTRSGETVYLEASAQGLISNDNICRGFVGTLSEVGNRVQQENIRQATHRTLDTLINNLPGLVYRCRNNRQWTMEYMSKGCEALTGYPAEALVNNKKLTYADLILPQDREQVWEHVQAALRENRPFELMYRIQTATGDVKWVLERGHGNFYTSGELLGVEGFITDITRERHEQLRLRSDSLYDSASELPTPALFLDRIKMALLNATPGEHPAVLVVHLNQLQNWHESLAPEDRERALLSIGRRIEGALERSDSLCRWTRNEFAILRTRTPSVDDGIKLAEKVQKALRAPIGDGDDAFFLTTSIGLATGFEAATTDSAEDVIGFASGAAARASNIGLGRIEIANLDDAPAA